MLVNKMLHLQQGQVPQKGDCQPTMVNNLVGVEAESLPIIESVGRRIRGPTCYLTLWTANRHKDRIGR
jgi:hypothetical protein